MEALAEYWASMFDETVEADRAQKIYGAYRKRLTVLNEPLPVNKTIFNSPHRYEIWYLKGSWIIRMLHKTLGKDAFKRAIQLFYERFQGRRAETTDFIQCCEEVSRRDLTFFFSQWLERSDLPLLSLEWQQTERELAIIITQHQGGQPFYLDTEVLIESVGRGRVEQLIIDKPVQTYKFPVSGQVISAQLDPRVVTLFKELK
jgi:aminopeptidase N